MKKLALLDFDGTVYNGDSMLDFAKFVNPKRYRKSVCLIAIPMGLSALRLKQRSAVKAQFLAINFKGMSQSFLEEKGRAFFEQHRDRCFTKAVNWIQSEKEKGTQLVILSASFEEWLKPFSDNWGIELVCGQLNYKDQNFTGKWIGENLVGSAKSNAVKTRFDLTEYEHIVAFGDRKSDRKLKSIATEFYANYFE